MYLRTLVQSWLALVLLHFGSAFHDDDYVQLESDSPAVLDAPIVFTAKLLGRVQDKDLTTIRWRFSDNASPGHYKETDSNSSVTERNYTLVYPAYRYEPGIYEMTLTIYYHLDYDYYDYWRQIGKHQIKFEITSALNGKLDVEQAGIREVKIIKETSEGTALISSVKQTRINVKFHDPSKYVNNAIIDYFWFIDTVNYGQTNKGQFIYNFTILGTYWVEMTTIAYLNNSTKSYMVQDDSGSTLQTLGENYSKGVKLGIFQKALFSEMPIGGTNVTGDVILKHDQLVDLNVKCNGTGPWSYCWSIQTKGYVTTGNETCEDPQFLKAECNFSIIWFFKKSDTYNLLVLIENGVSSHVEVIPVTVYNVASSLPLFIIVLPVVSSIAAIVIVMSGIALNAHYKTRLAIEVADFDFGEEDEELQAKTFWERLRESIENAITGTSGNKKDSSSLSGRRSVQMPGPSASGYGTIT